MSDSLSNSLNETTERQAETAEIMPRDVMPTDAELVELRRWWDAFGAENTPARIRVLAIEVLELREQKAALLSACKRADALLSHLMKTVDLGKTFDLNIAELNGVLCELPKIIAKAEGR